jgi:sugar lactone lactonase YvrE
MITHTAQPASATRHQLAEGPVWDAPQERLLWVDIAAAEVHEGRLEGHRVVTSRIHHLSEADDEDNTVGAVVPALDGRLLVAGHRGLHILAPDGHDGDQLQVVAPHVRSRLNDGACDPAGRFLVGTMSLDGRAGAESLLRLEDDGGLTPLDSDLTLANGLAWSPDGRLLYTVDSVPGVVWVREYDTGSGRCGERREALRVTGGLPDGLCVDADGNLWLAVWGAGQVLHLAPDGRLLGVVEVPAPNTTSVAFVGHDLDLLLITTASTGLAEPESARFPDSGRLFVADVGVRGLPSTPWNGAIRTFSHTA